MSCEPLGLIPSCWHRSRRERAGASVITQAQQQEDPFEEEKTVIVVRAKYRVDRYEATRATSRSRQLGGAAEFEPFGCQTTFWILERRVSRKFQPLTTVGRSVAHHSRVQNAPGTRTSATHNCFCWERRKSLRREARKRGAHNEFSPQRAVDPVHSVAGLADIFPSMKQAFG